jgi:hypothetical protein
MPRLRPQNLSGLVVIPTIELDSGVYRVSLGIDVGSSRTGPGTTPPQVVTREDLIVEVKNTTDGSFEPILSPDPGPLPVRALRVVQARGEFTFGQGSNPPAEVVVMLRNDRKSFPMSQTFPATPCLSHEPQEGGAFPVQPAAAAVLLDPARRLWPFAKPRCSVKRFDAPLHVQTDAAAKSESFQMEAALGSGSWPFPWPFSLKSLGCRCTCCEYRQFVRGTFTNAAGDAVLFDLPSGPLDPATYCEDGTIDEFGTNRHGYYGHRDTSTPGDSYGGTGGCTYQGNEKASCPPTDGAHLEFIGLIVDVCRHRVVAKRKWVVDL